MIVIFRNIKAKETQILTTFISGGGANADLSYDILSVAASFALKCTEKQTANYYMVQSIYDERNDVEFNANLNWLIDTIRSASYEC